MIKIKAIPQVVTEVNDAAQIMERVIHGPETPIPPSATLVFCDGGNYIVCETPSEAALVQDALDAADKIPSPLAGEG